MRAFLIFLVSLLCLCCKVTEPAKPSQTEVTAWREFEQTLHVDTDFNEQGRQIMELACERWRAFTGGRVRIHLEYDLDFESIEGLKAHKAAHHAVVLGVTSDFPIVEQLDESLGGNGFRPIAVTIRPHGQNEDLSVIFIVDRIPPSHFYRAVAHEFGHVIGFPDLPVIGSVMSGAEISGAPPVFDFTEADRQLCRGYGYCD